MKNAMTAQETAHISARDTVWAAKVPGGYLGTDSISKHRITVKALRDCTVFRDAETAHNALVRFIDWPGSVGKAWTFKTTLARVMQ